MPAPQIAPTPVTPPPDDRALWDVLLGLFGAPTVLVCREFKIYELLEATPRTREELHELTKLPLRPLEAILAMNVAARLMRLEEGRYSLTSTAAAYLLPTSPTSFGGFLDLITAASGMYNFEGLKKAAVTDASQVHGGGDLFEMHAARADLAVAFTHAMHGMSVGPSRAWPSRVDLSGARSLLDIGGGSGVHSIGALSAWPELRATVVDLPQVCQAASEYFAKAGLSARATAVPADMWKDTLPEADVHLYASIFHDWPLDKCLALAKRSYAHLPVGGRILVHEMLFNDDKSGPSAVAAMSVSMLFGTEGAQYSGKELCGVLAEAGFTELEVIPTHGYWSVVSGRKR